MVTLVSTKCQQCTKCEKKNQSPQVLVIDAEEKEAAKREQEGLAERVGQPSRQRRIMLCKVECEVEPKPLGFREMPQQLRAPAATLGPEFSC